MFEISAQKLCSGDWDRTLKLSVWDWNRWVCLCKSSTCGHQILMNLIPSLACFSGLRMKLTVIQTELLTLYA